MSINQKIRTFFAEICFLAGLYESVLLTELSSELEPSCSSVISMSYPCWLAIGVVLFSEECFFSFVSWSSIMGI
jgi:hypothetical protein